MARIMSNSSAVRRTKVVTTTNVVPMTEREAAEEFSAVVIDFEAGQLAQAARRTKEAAKAWKSAKRCPNGSSLINMARAIPKIRAWLYAEIERGVPAEAMSFDNPQALDVIFRGLQQLAMGAGTDGNSARQLLAQLMAGSK